MTAFESAFNTIQHLVKKFDEGFNHYMSAGYSEAEARQDFIDDFFIALGWDVSHKQQTNPYEQEVKIERSQKQQNESARKRADYAFFLNPNYKDEVFFVEAIKFILGLLNSNFIRLWFNTNFEAGLHIKINQLQKIPIVNINIKNPKQNLNTIAL